MSTTAVTQKKTAKPYAYKLRKGTRYKYLAIQKRMGELHANKRKRYDDCIKQLMDEFFIENELTIHRILKTEIETTS